MYGRKDGSKDMEGVADFCESTAARVNQFNFDIAKNKNQFILRRFWLILDYNY